ncbi:hypothetical protein [Pigmentibacter ruber]|uniref:hypothetical protein n=1 Tax=Pigmentibacter ruber TaxID=2683196 RepID=UPI00131D703D|nr:hypothetical protein [Pigmentibacter ruber]
MQKRYTILPICSFFVFAFYSCGKKENYQNQHPNEQAVAQSFLNSSMQEKDFLDYEKGSNEDSSVDEQSFIPTTGATANSLLQGFNKMGYSFTDTCLESDAVLYPKSIEKTAISLSDNMKEEDFRTALNVGVSATVPVKGIELSPEIKYSREAASSRLSRTTTYSVYVRLGETKVSNLKENKLTLKPFAYSYFNANGKLNDPFNFIKKCGDEVVVAQKLSAKLLITLKLNFDSQKTLNTVEGKLGLAQNILSVAGKIGINTNVKYLDDETKKGMHLNLYAVQLGGNPVNLTEILSMKTSCEIAKIEECQNTINQLNKYIAEDFSKQLSPNNPDSWVVESSQTMPYDELNILDPSGKSFNFNWLENYGDSLNYSKLKNIIHQAISREVNNYSIANSILESTNLAIDERNNLKEILDKSEINIDSLRNFSKECHKNLIECLNNYKEKISHLLLDYDESFLKPNIGSLIAKTKSGRYPLPGQQKRSSVDFLDFKSIVDSGKYSSVYFRLKTLDNKLILNQNIRFDLMCNKPWYRGFDPVIFAGVYAGYEILTNTIQANHSSLCSGTELGYVASPRNVPYSDFIVEVWGRD